MRMWQQLADPKYHVVEEEAIYLKCPCGEDGFWLGMDDEDCERGANSEATCEKCGRMVRIVWHVEVSLA